MRNALCSLLYFVICCLIALEGHAGNKLVERPDTQECWAEKETCTAAGKDAHVTLEGKAARDLFLSAVKGNTEEFESFDTAMCFVKEVNDGIKVAIPAECTMHRAFAECTLDLSKLDGKASYLTMELALAGGYDDEALVEIHLPGEEEMFFDYSIKSASVPAYVMLDVSQSEYVTISLFGYSREGNELLMFDLTWD